MPKPLGKHSLLGIFGGTFDPIHFGHLRLAEEARDHLGLEAVLWIPAGQPPHRGVPRVTARQRMDMVQLAIGDNPAFQLDPAEVEADRPSYTVPTLERLRAEYGRERSLLLLVGADAFAGLPTWHRWRDLFDLANIGVAHRPGFPVEASSLPTELAEQFEVRRVDRGGLAGRPAGGISTFPMTPLAIAATQIRQLLAEGRSPRYLLPAAVLDYIETNRLYRNS
ncbi:MAG TPA: nicotinate-nucleotide adenylyltransferase [Rhodocyclaceae bacterium]|nr:nicotinate-nucleotide adenylyltransferase [Rhodocyclaceae bacterium]